MFIMKCDRICTTDGSYSGWPAHHDWLDAELEYPELQASGWPLVWSDVHSSRAVYSRRSAVPDAGAGTGTVPPQPGVLPECLGDLRDQPAPGGRPSGGYDSYNSPCRGGNCTIVSVSMWQRMASMSSASVIGRIPVS